MFLHIWMDSGVAVYLSCIFTDCDVTTNNGAMPAPWEMSKGLSKYQIVLILNSHQFPYPGENNPKSRSCSGTRLITVRIFLTEKSGCIPEKVVAHKPISVKHFIFPCQTFWLFLRTSTTKQINNYTRFLDFFEKN